jgi:hypothetical protein
LYQTIRLAEAIIKQGLLKPILILLKAASGVISTACDVIPSDFIC